MRKEIADLALIRIESEAERESEMEAHFAERLLHVQMAEAAAQFKGYGTSKIKSVSASSVNRGVKSPSDISMITRLVQTLKIHPVSFKDGVRLTLEAEAKN